MMIFTKSAMPNSKRAAMALALRTRALKHMKQFDVPGHPSTQPANLKAYATQKAMVHTRIANQHHKDATRMKNTAIVTQAQTNMTNIETVLKTVLSAINAIPPTITTRAQIDEVFPAVMQKPSS